VVNGCGRNDPASVTRAFIDAGNRGDTATAESLLTKLARQNIHSDKGKNLGFTKKDPVTGAQRKWDDYSIGSATIEGDKATVPVTTHENGKSEIVKFRLRNEDGAWRVYALAFQISPGNDMTLDLEHPEQFLAELFKAMPKAMEQGAKAMGDGLTKMGEGFGRGNQIGTTGQ
jgi:hypothetical protein